MSRFSDNLKRFRKQNHMTQTQLAEKIGVGRSAVSMYEMGEREPDFETLEAIADTFNVDMALLIGTETKKAPSEDGVIRELAEAMRDRPDVRGLAEVAMANNPDEVAAVTEFLRNLRGGK